MLACKRALKGLEEAVAKEEINPVAKVREKVVLFYQKNGLKLTQEAYGTKRSTLYNWQKKYKEFGICGLIESDRRPKRKRKSQISKEVEEFILRYRQKFGKTHQDEIKPHLDEYCLKTQIKTISVPKYRSYNKEA
jgi:transposase